MMDDNYIETQLKKFDITEAAIEKLQNRFKDLRIKHVDDTQGYKLVRSARIEMKNYRIDVEKRRKELTEDALKYQRKINDEAKRIIALLSPIEKYLAELEDEHVAEKGKIKQEKERLEALALQTRINKLISMGFTFDGLKYRCEYLTRVIAPLELKLMVDKFFDLEMAEIEDKYKKHIEAKEAAEKVRQEQLAREAAEHKAEQQRLIQQRRELEMEQERLADIAYEQEKQAALLKAERRIKLEIDRLEKEKAQKNREEAEAIRDQLLREAADTSIAVRRDLIIDEARIYSIIASRDDLRLREISVQEIEIILINCEKFLDEAIEKFILETIEKVICPIKKVEIL